MSNNQDYETDVTFEDVRYIDENGLCYRSVQSSTGEVDFTGRAVLRYQQIAMPKIQWRDRHGRRIKISERSEIDRRRVNAIHRESQRKYRSRKAENESKKTTRDDEGQGTAHGQSLQSHGKWTAEQLELISNMTPQELQAYYHETATRQTNYDGTLIYGQHFSSSAAAPYDDQAEDLPVVASYDDQDEEDTLAIAARAYSALQNWQDSQQEPTR
ncbi:hypothetical protein B9479_005789 [Cryptococcus floricola]|uniref:BZIP domain-containing protein n=1 Tax=Cryptococcus floricola TaxID=2591691 RepID=A0A5D3AS88_9TREE|nr:hypothetical protein B9479_005789 [Cryptococcus floricola]